MVLADCGHDLIPSSSNSSRRVTALQIIRMLLELLRDKEMDIEDIAETTRGHLEQCVHLCQFESEAKQVLSWIKNAESMLSASFTIPQSLQEAEDLRTEHEQFQVAIEVHFNAPSPYTSETPSVNLSSNQYLLSWLLSISNLF